MQLKAFILCILTCCLAAHVFICSVQYKNLVECSKFSNDIYSDSFSIFYSFGEISSKFISALFQYLSMIFIITFFQKISALLVKDSYFVFVVYSFYYYIGIILPSYYNTFIIEQKSKFNKLSHIGFISISIKDFLLNLILLEAFVKFINIICPLTNVDQQMDEGGNEMADINYATENESIRPNEKKEIKNPWIIVFFLYLFISLIAYDNGGNSAYIKTNSVQRNINGTEIQVMIDSKHTMHSRVFLSGYCKPVFAVSDTVIQTLPVDEVIALIETLKGQLFYNLPAFELFLIFFKAFFLGLIYRTVFNIGFTSFGLNRYENNGRTLIVSFSIFIPIIFLMSPFETLIQRSIYLKSDCYATNHFNNLYKAVLHLYKWNGHAVKNSQIYKMFFANEVTLDDRLINIERCYSFNNKK